LELESTGKKLKKCFSWYDALCLINTGISISENIELKEDIFPKNKKN